MEPTQPQPDEAQTAPWLAPQPTLPPKERRSWKRLALPAAVAAGGLLLGAAAGAGIMAAVSDPTQSEEYAAQVKRLADARETIQAREARNDELADQVTEAEDEMNAAKDAAAEDRAELDERERDVEAREAAVTATEQQIAARSIGTGIWTVGVDVEPGTYRVDEALTGYCYWGIYTSGTNGDDILENDGPTGGFPTVTLSVGQDFENSGCGTFVKQ